MKTLGQLLGEPQAVPEPDGMYTLDAIREAEAAVDVWENAHPVRARTLGLASWPGHAMWRLRRWHPAGRVRWFIQRGRRGWSDRDVISVDSYIAGVLSQMLHSLASGHAYPGTEPWETPEKWVEYLHDLSARLAAWNDDTFIDDSSFEETRAAMEEFGRNFGHFWY